MCYNDFQVNGGDIEDHQMFVLIENTCVYLVLRTGSLVALGNLTRWWKKYMLDHTGSTLRHQEMNLG